MVRKVLRYGESARHVAEVVRLMTDRDSSPSVLQMIGFKPPNKIGRANRHPALPWRKGNWRKRDRVDDMKKEYDFSKAEQGKFYRPIEKLEIPVYLDKEVKEFFSKTASKKKVGIDKVVNTILRKEMEMMKAIGV